MRRVWPLLLLVVGSGAVAYQDPIPLSPGTGKTFELRSGENHQHSLPLRAGQFLDAVVQQMGIDLDVTLLGPDGQAAAHSDLPNGDQGPEQIVAIAASSGDYKLVIRSLNPNAPSGRYELRVEPVREATSEDRHRVEAERLIDEAHDLRKKPTSTSIAAALEKDSRALAYFQSASDRYREALTLNEIGLLRAISGDYRGALEPYRAALDLFSALGDRPRMASAENNLGGALDRLGDFQAAMDHLQRALAGYRAVGQRTPEANVLNNIGALYTAMGEWQKAVAYLRQALPAQQAAGDKARQAATLHNLGAAAMYTDLETAIDYNQQALELRRTISDRPGEALSLAELASAHVIAGKLDAAIEYGEKSLSIYRSLGNRPGEARILRTLGVAYARRGDSERGLNLLGDAVARAHELGNKREEAISLIGLGLAQPPSLAKDSFQQASTLAQQLGDSGTLAKSEVGLARAERDLGDLPSARQHAERAIELTEKVRANAGGQEARASYLSSALDTYSTYIDILMLQHEPAAALEISERSRARSLLEMLSESGADIREGVDPKLLQREREITDLLNAKGTRLLPLMGRQTPQTEALNQEIRQLETEYRDIETEIRKTSPRYASLTQPAPLKLPQIQNDVLDDDSLLLEYALGEKRSTLWAVTKTRIDAWELPPRDRIETAARNLLQALKSPDAARELSDLILAPAASTLAGKRLLIVADGALQQIPFAMLPIPKSTEPLVTAHEIVFLPSASALAVLRQETAGRKPAPKTLAVFADPVFDTARPSPSPDATRILEHLTDNTLRIPRLPFTAIEADHILKVAGGSGNWKATGYQASRAAALSGRLSQYRYLHFATHGVLDTERPSLSALVLAQIDEYGNPQDGFLRVNDIYTTRLSADLVVLSACQTGLGKEVRGEGLLGLTRAFLYAGAPRVVVSLWNVNDRATADLMTTLYRGMLRQGKTPAAALRAAQLELRKHKQWESPYYWAAFVQHGEWR